MSQLLLLCSGFIGVMEVLVNLFFGSSKEATYQGHRVIIFLFRCFDNEKYKN